MPDCWWFSKFAWCTNGEECLYRHILATQRVRQCPDYDRGFCQRGPQCPYKHIRKVICPAYIAGFCEKGPACKEGHPKPEPMIPLPPVLHEVPPDDKIGPPAGYFGYSFERGTQDHLPLPVYEKGESYFCARTLGNKEMGWKLWWRVLDGNCFCTFPSSRAHLGNQ